MIHIGYHKTATTWLQRHLFNNERASFVCPWSIDEAARQLVDPHAFDFDTEQANRYFEKEIQRASQAGRVPVLSSEELSGNPHSGGYANKTIADRLVAVFPDALVLIVIREQLSMLQSVYKQYLRMGGAASPMQYFFPTTVGPRVPRFRFENFEYHRLIGYYIRLVGRNRVCVLPMEMLKEDARAFVKRIAEFAGATDPGPLPEEKVYAAHSGFTAALQRQVNRLFGHTAVNPGAPFHTWRLVKWYERLDRLVPSTVSELFDRPLERFIEKYAGGRYARSNGDVVQLTGLNLGRFGYELPGGSP